VIRRRLPGASSAALAVAAEFPAPAHDRTERNRHDQLIPLAAFYPAADYRQHFMPTPLKNQRPGLPKPK